MKFLLTIFAIAAMQILSVSAQENSKKTFDEKNEKVVPIINQIGSRVFRCFNKNEVFQSTYEAERRTQGGDKCINPVDMLQVDFDKQTLISYQAGGDCFIRARAEVFRSDTAKTYRVSVIKKSGGCRAVGHFDGWLTVAKIPEDYKVVFSEKILGDDEDFETELLEETLSQTENSTPLKTRTYEMNRCVNYYREGEIVIKSQTELLKEVRDDASRKACLEKLEKIDFKKDILLGVTFYSGYCGYPRGLKHSIMRDDRKKNYTLLITYDDPYGRTCRALGVYDLWLAVPKPPDDYEIKIKVASVLNKKF